jgi:hypothetical protein
VTYNASVARAEAMTLPDRFEVDLRGRHDTMIALKRLPDDVDQLFMTDIIVRQLMGDAMRERVSETATIVHCRVHGSGQQCVVVDCTARLVARLAPQIFIAEIGDRDRMCLTVCILRWHGGPFF